MAPAFTNDSIDELDRLAHDSGNVFNMTRGGYILATRKDNVDDLVASIPGNIDVDVVSERQGLHTRFPALDCAIQNVVHIRRGGDGYKIDVRTGDGAVVVAAAKVVNAAGPFAKRIAAMIDLDPKQLSWSDEERDLLSEEPELKWLTELLPAGTHCRPDGGVQGKWVKLGWAYNKKSSEPLDDMANESASDPRFPEIVIRGAAAFLPALQAYVDAPLTNCARLM